MTVHLLFAGAGNFRIHGSVYHAFGDLQLQPGQRPQFAQLYFYDTEHELQHRMHVMSGMDSSVLASLQAMLHHINPFVRDIRAAAASGAPNLQLRVAAGVKDAASCSIDAQTTIQWVFRGRHIANFGRPFHKQSSYLIIFENSRRFWARPPQIQCSSCNGSRCCHAGRWIYRGT